MTYLMYRKKLGKKFLYPRVEQMCQYIEGSVVFVLVLATAMLMDLLQDSSFSY
jgi:hypothetical protein